MNFYPFHIGDYTTHTAHLEPMEDLAYRRLLDAYYLREGCLPADIAEICRITRLRSYAKEVETVLREFFVLSSEGWMNVRAEEELGKFKTKSEKARRSAEQRWSSNANAMRTHSEGNATNTNTNTNTNSVSKDTDGKPSLSTDEIIFSYGVPLLINGGASDKQARSFLGGLRKAHGDEALVNALRDCIREKPLQPLEWLAAVLPPKAPKLNRQEALEARNRAVVKRLLEKEALNAGI